jgi:hypothetical protein
MAGAGVKTEGYSLSHDQVIGTMQQPYAGADHGDSESIEQTRYSGAHAHAASKDEGSMIHPIDQESEIADHFLEVVRSTYRRVDDDMSYAEFCRVRSRPALCPPTPTPPSSPC